MKLFKNLFTSAVVLAAFYTTANADTCLSKVENKTGFYLSPIQVNDGSCARMPLVIKVQPKRCTYYHR